MSPPAHDSSSSLDKAIIAPLPTTINDFKHFQELFERVVENLEIPLKEVNESHHKLLRILHILTSLKFALPINETLMEPANNMWQMPATISRTCKRADKTYYVPAKEMEFVFIHPPSNSCVMSITAQTNGANKLHISRRPTTKTGKLIWQKNVLICSVTTTGI